MNRLHRWARRAACAAACTLAFGGLAVPAALAGPGGLGYAGCIGDPAGCTQITPGVLGGADGVAPTPDGRQLYVASFGGGTVSHFTIDQAGNLVYAGCVGDQAGCTPVTPGALDGAVSVAVTPDGQHLYAGANDAVSHFTIDGAGNLSFAGCIGNHAGCTPLSPAGVLDGGGGLAVTPDGQHLYVAAFIGAAVSHFTIDGAGNLSFAGCIGNHPGCTQVTPGALGGADGATMTPDGHHLYVTSYWGNAVSHFTVDGAGNLSFAGCIGDRAGCTGVTPGALVNADGAAVTPDGHHLYAAGQNAVSHFTVDGAGNLVYAGCIGGHAGCTPVTPGALDGADAVAAASDGANLYVAAYAGNAVSHFRFDAAGNLIYAGCIGNHAGCTPVTAGALGGATGVAVTQDGANLYATANTGHAVSHFTIAGFTAVNPPPPGSPSPTPPPRYSA